MLFLFASVGATTIVVYSSLFESFRNLFTIDQQTQEAIETGQLKATKKQKATLFFGQLFHCPLCFGFWMSVVMYMFLYKFESYDVFVHFAYACAGSGASFLFYRIVK